MQQLHWTPTLRAVVAAALALAGAAQLHAASQAPVAAENGMVVTAQHLATQVGVDVLKRGGNAVDAAVAVGYALAVVYPAAGNLGGGGFMTMQLADGRKTFLDFREKAPLAATANMYLDKDGNVIKGLSTNGHLAVGVPGTVSGLELRAREVRHDEARRADRAGDRAGRATASCSSRATSTCSHTATDDFQKDPASGAIFLNKGEPFAVGQKLVQKDLAKTLRPSATRAPTASTRARSAPRSWRRARPARASSRRPTSTSTRRANWRRSNATTAATTSSRRRRRARAAWSSARC